MSELRCGHLDLCPICDYSFNSLTRKRDFSSQCFMLSMRSSMLAFSLSIQAAVNSVLNYLCQMTLYLLSFAAWPWLRSCGLRALVASPKHCLYPGGLRLCWTSRAALKKKRHTKIISCNVKCGRRDRELDGPTSLPWGWEKNCTLAIYIETTE